MAVGVTAGGADEDEESDIFFVFLAAGVVEGVATAVEEPFLDCFGVAAGVSGAFSFFFVLAGIGVPAGVSVDLSFFFADAAGVTAVSGVFSFFFVLAGTGVLDVFLGVDDDADDCVVDFVEGVFGVAATAGFVAPLLLLLLLLPLLVSFCWVLLVLAASPVTSCAAAKYPRMAITLLVALETLQQKRAQSIK